MKGKGKYLKAIDTLHTLRVLRSKKKTLLFYICQTYRQMYILSVLSSHFSEEGHIGQFIELINLIYKTGYRSMKWKNVMY